MIVTNQQGQGKQPRPASLAASKAAACSDPKRKPTAVGVQIDGIPPELRRIPHWVVWRYQWAKARWTKVPHAPNGRRADSTDPGTFSTFENVASAYSEPAHPWDGVGLVHLPEDGLVACDLDCCRDPVAGDLTDWATDIVSRVHSYTEVSPSGTGLRIYVRGRKPDNSRCKRDDVEMYDGRTQSGKPGGRFLTVTGCHYPGSPGTVETNQAAIDFVYRRYLLGMEAFTQGEGVRGPKRSALVLTVRDEPCNLDDDQLLARMQAESEVAARLIAGDCSGYASRSEAMMALANLVRFWGGRDRHKVLRLLRRTQLWSPDWDRASKIEPTLNKALEGEVHSSYRGAANGQSTRAEATGGVLVARPGRATRTPQELPPWVPFPLEALPGRLAEYVSVVSAALGCDPSFVALPALAAVASAIGNSRIVLLKQGWTEPAVLWTCVVGDSGTLKTPAFKKAVGPLFAIQHALVQRHDDARKAWEASQREAKRSKAQPEDEAAPPVLRRVICSDSTVERLAELLEENPRGLLLARDELAGWVGSFTRYKAAKGATDLPNWLEMHSAGTVVVDRKGLDRKSTFIARAFVCVTGGIQPGTLARAFGAEHIEAGLAARLLLAMPPRRAKAWTAADVSPTQEAAYANLVEALAALPMGRDGEMNVPVVVGLSSGAKARWVEFYNDWARAQEEAEGALASAYSKLEAAAARLALVHHVVEEVAAGRNGLAAVSERSMRSGIALAHWFGGQVRRVYGALDESDEDRDGRRLVEWVRARQARTGKGVTARDLQHAFGRRYRTAADALAALEGLGAAGLGRWTNQPPGGLGGQPTRRFEMAPPTPGDTADTTDTTSSWGDVEDAESTDTTSCLADTTTPHADTAAPCTGISSAYQEKPYAKAGVEPAGVVSVVSAVSPDENDERAEAPPAGVVSARPGVVSANAAMPWGPFMAKAVGDPDRDTQETCDP